MGLIRLPNNAFKKNAGTEVTTDIVVFRKKDGRPFEHAETFINTRSMQTGKLLDGVAETVDVNEYFHRHPDMTLGRMRREGTMYEGDSPALIAHPDKELVPQLQEAVRKLPRSIARDGGRTEAEGTTFGQASANQKEGSYQIRNGGVFQVRSGELAVAVLGARLRASTCVPMKVEMSAALISSKHDASTTGARSRRSPPGFGGRFLPAAMGTRRVSNSGQTIPKISRM